MAREYKEVRGVLFRKYRNVFGKHIFIIEENGDKTKIIVGKALYDKAGLGSKWTMGCVNRKLINVRSGFCENPDEYQ